MYRRIYSTEALVINNLRSPSNKFDGTFLPIYLLIANLQDIVET